MKKIKFLTMALVALSIISCTKENGVNTEIGGESAKISITIAGQGDVNKTRATGPGVAENQENQINDFAVFLFNADGLLNTQQYFTNIKNSNATIDNATTTAQCVYIVANTGATMADKGLFADIKNLADLMAVKGDLMVSANTASQVPTADKGLWMHGLDSKIDWVGTTGRADVNLGFSSARIDIIIKDNRSISEAYTFSENTVELMFAGKNANFFAAKPSTQTAFYSGTETKVTSVVSTALLHEDVNFNTDLSSKVVTHHFYTFGNDSGYILNEKRPTILTLSSLRTPKADGVGTTVSYPVHFSPEDYSGTEDNKAPFATIEPGKKYTVTITLNGDAPGTPDPEVPVTDASMTVTVKTAAWVPVTMDKEF